jgi:prephenate dehydrogenase
MMKRVVIVGTGLIGASVGLALRAASFDGVISGVDLKPEELAAALKAEAIDEYVTPGERALALCREADVVMLAVPVLAIMHWMDQLAPMLGPGTLVTDVGSTKLAICDLARKVFAGGDTARFLPGHPMAGKESGGAALGDASLFTDAMWLFTPLNDGPITDVEEEWREWVRKMGARTMDLDAARHDRICAWVSHLPQMVSTAMAAMLEDEFAEAPELAEEFRAIGGRALREMTRLGASPYSMWRDVALTNTEPVAATLFALEQRLAHVRENLRTPELREEFLKANAFRRLR